MIAKIQAVEIDKSNLRKGLEEAGFTIKELRDKDIRWRDITNTLQAKISANASGITTLHDTVYSNTTDTIKRAEFNWNNRYLFLKGGVYEDKGKCIGCPTVKTMKFDYTYETGIDIINEKKRKSNVISVYLSDPNAVVTTANSITINHKTPWYKKPWLWGATGLIGGYFIAK